MNGIDFVLQSESTDDLWKERVGFWPRKREFEATRT